MTMAAHNDTLTAVPALARYDELLTEAQALQRFPMLLSPVELRKARQNGEITYLPGKKGRVFYRPEELAAYIHRKEVKCQPNDRPKKNSGNTENTGSAEPPAPPSSMSTGMTEEAARRLEDHFERKYSKRPRTG